MFNTDPSRFLTNSFISASVFFVLAKARLNDKVHNQHNTFPSSNCNKINHS